MKLNGKRFHEVTRFFSKKSGAIVLLRSDGLILRRRFLGEWEHWKKFKPGKTEAEQEALFRKWFDTPDYIEGGKQPLSLRRIMNYCGPLADHSEGFCVLCGNMQSGCEPDARKYKCENCGGMSVFGAEELLIGQWVCYKEAIG